MSEITHNKAGLKFKLEYSGYLETTLVNLTHNDNQRIGKHTHRPVEVELAAFNQTVERIYREWRPGRMGVERYQARMKGKTVETVSMMNGILLLKATTKDIPFTLYTAAAWKNWINRLDSLDQLYKIGAVRGLLPHTIDTVLMALWLWRGDNPELAGELTPARIRNILRNVRLTRSNNGCPSTGKTTPAPRKAAGRRAATSANA